MSTYHTTQFRPGRRRRLGAARPRTKRPRRGAAQDRLHLSRPGRRFRLDLGARQGPQGDARRAERPGDRRLRREREGGRERHSDPQRPRPVRATSSSSPPRTATWTRASKSPSSSRTSSSSIAPAISSADNLGTYNSRFHQGRAVEGTIAGMMSKSGVIGYLGSYKVPEVVLGVNSFTLSAQAVNPKITTKLVMIDSWFDPAKEAAAVETLANLGCDVVAQHTDSPAGLAGVREAQGLVLRPGRGHGAVRAEDPVDRDRGYLGSLLHLARQGGSRRELEGRTTPGGGSRRVRS